MKGAVGPQPPVADAGPDQSVNVGSTVTFDGSGSYDPDGTISSYDWDFGDGSPHENVVTTTHSYVSSGTYTVTLTVTDNSGANDTDTAIVTVNEEAQTNELGVVDGYDQKSNVTLLGSGQVYIVQASDADRWETDFGYFTSFQLGNLPPEATTVASVTVYVEHYEAPGFKNGQLEWQIGTGWQVENPSVWANNTSIPIRKGVSNETTDSWDVSSLVNTPAQVNDLEFAIKNNDARKRTFANYVYVQVELGQGLGKTKPSVQSHNHDSI